MVAFMRPLMCAYAHFCVLLYVDTPQYEDGFGTSWLWLSIGRRGYYYHMLLWCYAFDTNMGVGALIVSAVGGV